MATIILFSGNNRCFRFICRVLKGGKDINASANRVSGIRGFLNEFPLLFIWFIPLLVCHRDSRYSKKNKNKGERSTSVADSFIRTLSYVMRESSLSNGERRAVVLRRSISYRLFHFKC